MKKKLTALVLVLAMVCAGVILVRHTDCLSSGLTLLSSTLDGTRKKSYRTQRAIVQDMVRGYAEDPDKFGPKTEKLLDELGTLDENAQAKWKHIMEYWDYVTHTMKIHYNTLPKGLDDTDALCIMVLGFELNADGTMKEELLGRLRTAYRSAKRYPNAYILCTGGGTASANKEATEADCMAQWLTEEGIDPERIIVENQSKTTTQNVMFSYEILKNDYPNVRYVALVTSDYHIPWAIPQLEAQFVLGEEGKQKISVCSNAAYRPKEPVTYSTMHYQANGIMYIAGYRG